VHQKSFMRLTPGSNHWYFSYVDSPPFPATKAVSCCLRQRSPSPLAANPLAGKMGGGGVQCHLYTDQNIHQICKWTRGQIFDACRILAMRISPKSLEVAANTHIFFSSKWTIFWELRHVSLRCDKCQKFGLKASIIQSLFVYSLTTFNHRYHRLTC
jgi:hypothetical protein